MLRDLAGDAALSAALRAYNPGRRKPGPDDAGRLFRKAA